MIEILFLLCLLLIACLPVAIIGCVFVRVFRRPLEWLAVRVER